MSFVGSPAITRMPWEIGNRLLRSYGLPTGLGWKKTVEKLATFSKSATDKCSVDALSAFAYSYREHIVCGEKCARFFALTSAALAQIQARLSQPLVVTPFSGVYPGTLGSSQLAEVNTVAPLVAGVEVFDTGTAVVFARKGVTEVRETALANGEDGIRRLITVRDEYAQFFDVVWIPCDGLHAEVRVDYPKDMHLDVAVSAQSEVRRAFNQWVGADVLGTAINLFPAIKKLYAAGGDGDVVEMEFHTATGSTKREKMDHSGKCLRNEKYHLGGSGAIAGDFKPFMINVIWKSKRGEFDTAPELTLSGRNSAYDPAPYLDLAQIRKCWGLSDYELVRSRLIKYALA